MLKLFTGILLFTSMSSFAASIKMEVVVDGKAKVGTGHFENTTNFYNGRNCVHLSRLRVRVENEEFNVSPNTKIDEHICSLLDHHRVDL